MKEVENHLITTADERTWKSDHPALFLGEWCRLYDRSETWMNMDAEVAAPFLLQADKKSSDVDNVQALFSKLLIELTVTLNAFHNTNYTSRYWNILLGHWLQRFVQVCFNRYFTIDQVLKRYNITSTTIFDSADYNLATQDSLNFIWACNDDVWNNILYARILKYIGCKYVSFNSIDVKNGKHVKQETSFSPSNYFSIKQLIKSLGSHISSRLSKSNDGFIVSSYLPKWQEIKLHFALGQWPQLWISPPLNTISIDVEMRKKFTISSEFQTGFELFVCDLLPDVIPACYLEGYDKLIQQIESRFYSDMWDVR